MEGDVSPVVVEDISITDVSILKVTLDPGVSYVGSECRVIIEEIGEQKNYREQNIIWTEKTMTWCLDGDMYLGWGERSNVSA